VVTESETITVPNQEKSYNKNKYISWHITKARIYFRRLDYDFRKL
jgi:hypothetical protein